MRKSFGFGFWVFRMFIVIWVGSVLRLFFFLRVNYVVRYFLIFCENFTLFFGLFRVYFVCSVGVIVMFFRSVFGFLEFDE